MPAAHTCSVPTALQFSVPPRNGDFSVFLPGWNRGGKRYHRQLRGVTLCLRLSPYASASVPDHRSISSLPLTFQDRTCGFPASSVPIGPCSCSWQSLCLRNKAQQTKCSHSRSLLNGQKVTEQMINLTQFGYLACPANARITA